MQRHVDRGTSKMVLMSILIFQLLILFPVLANSKNYLYDSQAAFFSKGCTRNYPVVWIDTAKWISNTELTYDEVRRLFSEAFRSVWRDSGADIGFSFAHDGATNSCYSNNDCSSGYFCDTYFQKCMPFYGVEITTAEFYGCQYSAAVLPYGSCGIKIILNTNHACDFYKKSWLFARHYGVNVMKHEAGHIYGLVDLYCFSSCSSDNDCQTQNPNWHCSLNDPFWPGPGSNCCRYIGDNPTISFMSYDLSINNEMSWADVSTLRRDFGQREL